LRMGGGSGGAAFTSPGTQHARMNSVIVKGWSLRGPFISAPLEGSEVEAYNDRMRF